MAPRIDHDALFKLLLTTFFREFLELAAPELAAALDPEPLIFLDKESFSDLLDPDRREADLVVQARMRDQSATLLLHLEHQAKSDPTLARRIFRYFGRFYDRYNLPVYPIALCSYTKPYKPASNRHQVQILSRTVLDFQFEVLQLSRLDWRDFLQTSNPAVIALMARMRIAPHERWRVKAASLRLLARARLSGAQRRLVSQFVDIYLPLQVAEREAFQAEVASFSPPERETVMELVTSWEREGRIKGREEGQRELIERQLLRKLGSLTPEQTERLGTLSSAQLVALGEALFDFATLADLEQWLVSLPAHQEAP
jgi:predicted transposase/invertase (TIGR01784 family)